MKLNFTKIISHFLILRKKCFVKLYHFSQECLSLKLASSTFGRKSRKWLFLQKSSSCQLYYVKISLQQHPLATVNHSQFYMIIPKKWDIRKESFYNFIKCWMLIFHQILKFICIAFLPHCECFLNNINLTKQISCFRGVVVITSA